MKAYWKYLLCAALGMGAFTACEDVPEPYNIPTENNNTPATPTVEYIENQDFTKGFGNYSTFNESGELGWTTTAKYGAVITGHTQDSDGNHVYTPGVTYLIGPKISLAETDSAYVIIEQAINYGDSQLAANHKLLIRAGEDGEWAELPMNFDGLGSSWDFVKQYIQLPDEYMGKDVQLALKHTCTSSNSTTWEVKQLAVAKGTAPSSEAPVIEDGVGSGTAEDPYDVPTTIKLIAAGPPSKKIYTKGIISKIDEIDPSYGNATYYISNDGTTTDQLEVYRGYGLGGAKFTSTEDLKVGDEVIVYGQVVYYNNKTMEFTQGSQLYSLNGEVAAGGGDTPTGEAAGSGTLEDPYNVAAAAKIASDLADNAKSDVIYFKGKVSSIKEQYSSNYGNGTFYISDDGTKNGQFYVYRALYLGNAKFVDGDTEIKEGDEVIICGKVTKYVSSYGTTLETAQGDAFLYSLNGVNKGGEIGGGDTPATGEAKGTGTLEDPFNPVAAYNTALALGSGNTSSQSYYIKGKISQIKYTFSAQYGTATFHISEDGTQTNEFYIYSTYYLGNKSWVDGNTQIAVGDEVIICGQLTNYNGTPETASKKSFIYSLNGVTEGGGDNPGGDTPGGNDETDGIAFSEFSNGNFEAWTDGQPDGWKSKSSASSATLSQSTDAHGGSYSVCVGGTTSGNKRLAYQEMALEAGTYTCTFWTKAATDAKASLCPGYAVVGSNITYNYDKGSDGKNKYVNEIAGEWQQVTYSFTISATSTVCLVIMNSKTTGTDLLIDDFTISKE